MTGLSSQSTLSPAVSLRLPSLTPVGLCLLEVTRVPGQFQRGRTLRPWLLVLLGEPLHGKVPLEVVLDDPNIRHTDLPRQMTGDERQASDRLLC